ncbi:monofunctional biosynthetic peptidoglycan transglycosylase [Cognatiyoonia sp.]|uniref:monofunctional biosynthetic peptidoglycan transglycosylase n=1 Tax=Cognatiyoonia sp. TaxID=2211652 RepID=UPI003F69F990
MARKKTSAKKTKKKQPQRSRLNEAILRVRRWFWRILFGVLAVVVLITLAYRFINPPITPYAFSESRRLGGIEHEWVAMEEIALVMARSAVAAEDANFCLHWGLDVTAIQEALDQRGSRGASTISQQVVKNVYLWHGRSWVRKSIEAMWTPLMEALWTKRRILEVYLNVAEFDEGVFGVQAASRHYFGVDAVDLSPTQAARLAALLPSPKTRSASNPSAAIRRRAAAIVDGAATIHSDGRVGCFER